MNINTKATMATMATMAAMAAIVVLINTTAQALQALFTIGIGIVVAVIYFMLWRAYKDYFDDNHIGFA